MKKAILITLILSFLLCGCNDSGTSQSAESDDSSQITNETDETAGSNETDETAAAKDDRIYTLDMYLQISMGSTYEEVTVLTGSPGDASVDGDVIRQYLWENEDGSNISVTFSDGTANAKTQAYLGPYLEGKEKVTKKMFLQLSEGFSLSDAEKILGKGTEMMRQIISGEESVTYLWSNSDGSGISIIFKDGKAADLNDMMLD